MKKIDRKVNPTLEGWWQPSFRAENSVPAWDSRPGGGQGSPPLLREPPASFGRVGSRFVMLITRLLFRPPEKGQNLPLSA